MGPSGRLWPRPKVGGWHEGAGAERGRPQLFPQLWVGGRWWGGLPHREQRARAPACTCARHTPHALPQRIACPAGCLPLPGGLRACHNRASRLFHPHSTCIPVFPPVGARAPWDLLHQRARPLQDVRGEQLLGGRVAQQLRGRGRVVREVGVHVSSWGVAHGVGGCRGRGRGAGGAGWGAAHKHPAPRLGVPTSGYSTSDRIWRMKVMGFWPSLCGFPVQRGGGSWVGVRR